LIKASITRIISLVLFTNLKLNIFIKYQEKEKEKYDINRRIIIYHLKQLILKKTVNIGGVDLIKSFFE